MRLPVFIAGDLFDGSHLEVEDLQAIVLDMVRGMSRGGGLSSDGVARAFLGGVCCKQVGDCFESLICKGKSQKDKCSPISGPRHPEVGHRGPWLVRTIC